MGRGRQKAKHTKVARELKYFSPDTNYSALERELGHADVPHYDIPTSDENLSKWAEFADEEPSDSADESDDDAYEDTYAAAEMHRGEEASRA